MIDVTHDGHDRWPRLELFGRVVGSRRGLEIGSVLLLLHGLEAELAGNQLDLVEVEALVDRHHESEVLERKADDLNRGRLQYLRQLADCDELVDANGLFLTLYLGLLLRGKLFAI